MSSEKNGPTSLMERLRFLALPEEGVSPARYRILRRNIFILMILVTTVPLVIMAAINYHEYQAGLKQEILSPLKATVSRTTHSFDLFLAERLSAVSFVASAYGYDELMEEKTLNRIFRVMREEFGEFVDLGVVNAQGMQVAYMGPYDLKGKDYSQQSWYHQVQIKGTYISDVFLGYRKFPHIALAVHRWDKKGQTWVLRATIDTGRLNTFVASMGLDRASDVFLLNKEGVLQTPSRIYGRTLEKFPLQLPPTTFEANVVEVGKGDGDRAFLAYTYFANYPYVLAVVKQRAEVLKPWYSMRSELVFVFLSSVLVIFLVVFGLTDLLVKRMQECDEKREAAFREMEHNHKLSSIGRLAAGVAHEINNPMAIINEKAGLMKDLIEYSQDFPQKERFLSITDSILNAVNRCGSITHRLLGFARRMDVSIEILNLGDLVKETLAFLEKEALYHNVEVRLELAEGLPGVASDRGQLQQVFLNLLNNALAAVEDGGTISISARETAPETVAVTIKDNGCGMSEETLKHIFEPFFTTKGNRGTGLGLPITYGIVKKLGGDIEVRSKEGEGTEVTVFLPVKSPEGANLAY
ncbi:MAG: sensor histidine kinase [Syntrophobacteraceae bacterium]